MPCSSHLLRSGILGQKGSTLYTGTAASLTAVFCWAETRATAHTPMATASVRAEFRIVARESSTPYPCGGQQAKGGFMALGRRKFLAGLGAAAFAPGFAIRGSGF